MHIKQSIFTLKNTIFFGFLIFSAFLTVDAASENHESKDKKNKEAVSEFNLDKNIPRIAIAVSIIGLLWNLGNTIFTYRINNSTRKNALKNDHFNNTIWSYLSPIIQEITDISNDLNALCRHGETVHIIKEVTILNEKYVNVFTKLQSTLSRFDQDDSVCKVKDWSKISNEYEDKILQLFNDANSYELDHVNLLSILRKLHSEMNALIGDLNKKVMSARSSLF